MSRRINALGAGVCVFATAMGAQAVHAESLADAISLAYQTNPSLQAQRAQLRSTDETYVQARAGYRPNASVQGSLGWRWQNLGVNNCTIFIPNCDLSPETNSISTTLSVTQPIYTGGRS